MYEFPKLKKQVLIFAAILFSVILIVGLILLGLGYNEAFYNDNPALYTTAKIITEFGGDMVFIILLALIYLTFDKRYAKYLLTQFIIQLFINSTVKDICKDPRPSWNIVDGEPIETSYGFPSGHSQNAVGFYGYNMYMLQDHPKRKPWYVICTFFLIAIPITRLIIGVHDLDDVIGGLTIGIFIATAFSYLAPLAVEKLGDKPWKTNMLIALAVSLLAWVLSIVWCLYGLQSEAAAEHIGQAAGFLVAFSFSFFIEENFINYQLTKDKKTNLILAIIGVVIIVALYLVLGAVFKLFPGPLWLLRFIRYVLFGAVVVIIVPLVLKKLQPKFVKAPKAEESKELDDSNE
jgi:undecaprenyl-diphosphatase